MADFIFEHRELCTSLTELNVDLKMKYYHEVEFFSSDFQVVLNTFEINDKRFVVFTFDLIDRP